MQNMATIISLCNLCDLFNFLYIQIIMNISILAILLFSDITNNNKSNMKLRKIWL